MAKKIRWEVDGQVVTSADVRRWMQSVAARVPEHRWKSYIKGYDVVGKIARHKALGTFEALIEREAAYNAVKVRAPRRLGTLQRLRKVWCDGAANNDAFGEAAEGQALQPALEVRA